MGNGSIILVKFYYYFLRHGLLFLFLTKDCVGKEFDWTALRKQEFDNMADYLAAKEDRIREQAQKSGQKLLENEKALRPKPAKIAKDDK